MKKLALSLLFLVAPAFAQEPQVCVSERQSAELFRGVMEMSTTINRQRAEIDALKRLLAEHGIEYVPAWQRFIQQIEAAQHGR